MMKPNNEESRKRLRDLACREYGTDIAHVVWPELFEPVAPAAPAAPVAPAARPPTFEEVQRDPGLQRDYLAYRFFGGKR